jgi:hypothetical protein
VSALVRNKRRRKLRRTDSYRSGGIRESGIHQYPTEEGERVMMVKTEREKGRSVHQQESLDSGNHHIEAEREKEGREDVRRWKRKNLIVAEVTCPTETVS